MSYGREESAIERDLRYENERLEHELRERKEREAREYDQRERERKERFRAMLPSNRLYNGEITDADEAMQAHINALHHEDHGFVHDDDDEQGKRFAAEWKGYIASAQATYKEYRERVAAAREAFQAAERAIFEDFAKSEDSTRKNIGEAGLSGDWSRLAI